MPVAQLKEKLIHQIEKSDDIDLLEDINRLLGLNERTQQFFKLNEAQIANIAEDKSQITKGELLTNE